MVERTQGVSSARVRTPQRQPDQPGLNPAFHSAQLPPDAALADPSDYDFIESSLAKRTLLFHDLDRCILRSLAAAMRVLPLAADQAVLAQGETGSRLCVIRSGKFEVRQMRGALMVRVSTIDLGMVFGEMGLMYDCPRSATVAATTDASVWVLERDVFRRIMREGAEAARAQGLALLGSVPLLSPLRPDQRAALADACQEEAFAAGSRVISAGDLGDKFYIIQEGEAQVIQEGREVNRLFRSDFFGEQALLQDEPRAATVVAVTPLVCLTLDRRTFVMVLGPLQDIMAKEKSPEVAKLP